MYKENDIHSQLRGTGKILRQNLLSECSLRVGGGRVRNGHITLRGGSLCQVLDGPLVVYIMQGACGDLQADAECNTPQCGHQEQCPKYISNDDTGLSCSNNIYI